MKMAFQLCVLDAYDWFMSEGAVRRQAKFDSMRGQLRGVQGWRRRCGMRLRSAGCRGHDMLMKLQRVSITSGRRGTAPPTPQLKEELCDAANEPRGLEGRERRSEPRVPLEATRGRRRRRDETREGNERNKSAERKKRKKSKGRCDEGTRTRTEAVSRRACRIANSSYAKLQ